jgi:signal transduction histidine kinase
MIAIWNLSEFILVSVTIVGTLTIAQSFSRLNRREMTMPKKILQINSVKEDLMISLSQVQAEQRQLISNFSHELRTPLTVVYGYMQSIQRRSENLTDLQKDALKIAMLEMQHTINLLQESLELARLDRDSICFLMVSVKLQNLVSEVIATFEKVAEREIVFECEEKPILVLADVDRLKQVLSRLIDNAIRYSDTMITIKLEKSGDYAAISICDRGCGIPIKDQPHIFSPFYRVDRSRSRITGGVGLGLTIAKVLVEAMGGTLSVDSQLGEGSTFKVMLKSSI